LVSAQPELAGWFRPELGQVPVRGDYRVTWFPDERVEGQRTKLGYNQHDLSYSAPIWQNPFDEWFFSTHVRSEVFNTGAVLPDTGQPFPDDLWNVHVGTSYRHLFSNGWIGGGNVTVGSASDKPFHSFDEMVVGASAFLRVPQGEHNAWLFSLNYSTNREFLNGVPLPGVAYFYAPTDWFQATIGLPFASMTIRPLEDLTLQFTYAPLTNIHTKVIYRIIRSLRVYAGFDWGEESYFRVGRLDDRDRLFYYDKRLSAGLIWSLNEHISFDVSGGYTFDRMYFEGRDFSHRSFNRLDIGDGALVGVQAAVKF
jgi:hypothetical protein